MPGRMVDERLAEKIRLAQVEWHNRLAMVQATGLLEGEFLDSLIHLVQPDNIGHGQGQIRPGIEGSWQVFQAFSAYLPEQICFQISGLRPHEIGEMRRREAFHGSAFSLAIPEEVAEFHRISGLSEGAVELELANLLPFA